MSRVWNEWGNLLVIFEWIVLAKLLSHCEVFWHRLTPSSLLETLEIILMTDQYFLKMIWNSPNQNYIILPDLESFPSIDCVYFGMKYNACFFK